VPWYHLVAERDHEIQNPTSEEKIRLLGNLLRLDSETAVLDIACGRGGPAIVLASEFGCRITGVERTPEFAAAARERLAKANLAERVDVVEADARDYPLGDEAWDVVLCLGATFIWEGLEGTLAALLPAVRSGGRLAVGEPYWRRDPPGGTDLEGYVSLDETVARFERAGLAATGLIAASPDDWDRYESFHWRAVEEWLAANPEHPEAPDLRREHEKHKRRHLTVRRDFLGWAIVAGWKRA
jgi:SAM-dependent methyltransferase